MKFNFKFSIEIRKKDCINQSIIITNQLNSNQQVMSRNREFDQIFLRGSFDNGLVDGTAFAAQAVLELQNKLIQGDAVRELDKGSSRATQRQLNELKEMQARQSEQRAHLVVLGQPPRAEALQGYQCVDLADTQVIDTDEQQAARQLCFSRDGLNRSAPGSRATSTTVYQNGKQVVRLNSGGMASEKMGGFGGQRLPKQSNQTSLNQTQTNNSHSQVISPHFYRQKLPHGTEDQLHSGGPGYGSADIGMQGQEARVSAEMRGSKVDQNLDLKAVSQQNLEMMAQNIHNDLSQEQREAIIQGVKSGPPGQSNDGPLQSGRHHEFANSAQDDITQQQMLSELLLMQQLQKDTENMRNEAHHSVEKTNLRNNSVHSAAKSAAPNEAVQYLDQLSSVSGKVASAHLGGGPIILENDDQLGAQQQRRVRKQKTMGSVHESKSKESKMDSKSQTHSQIMKMMKTMEEFGKQAQLGGADSGQQAVLPTELLLAQLSPAHSKDSEWAALVHLLPARSDDAIALSSPQKYPSTRRNGMPISVRVDDNDYMPKRPQDVVFSQVTAEKRAIQICNCLIGLAMDQTVPKPAKPQYIYPNGPLGAWSARFASVSSKNTGRMPPFPRLDARSDTKKYTQGTADIKSSSSHISGCTGCREILQNRQLRNQEAVLQQGTYLQKHICRTNPQSASLLNLFRNHQEELILSRGFQQLQGFLADPHQLSPKSREKKDDRLCRKIEETIQALQRQQPTDEKKPKGITDAELLGNILKQFETLQEQRIHVDRKQRRAEREKQHKYKIVKGQIFEAVQVKEHQFSKESEDLSNNNNITFLAHGSKGTPRGEQLTDNQDSAYQGSLTSRNRSYSKSKSRTRSKSPGGGQISSPNQKQDYFGNPQSKDSSRIYGVGFGCDITYKDKDKIVYRFSSKAGQIENATSVLKQQSGYTTGAAGGGTFQTIEEARRASTKQQTYSPMHGKKTREGQESVFKETHLSSTLHHTINDSGQSPMKTPKLQNNTQTNLERPREGQSSTIQDIDQNLIHSGWSQSRRPLTSKMRAQQVFSRIRETGHQSEARPQSSGTGQPREQPMRMSNQRGFGAIGGMQRSKRPSFATDGLDNGRLMPVTSNNPYSISANDKTVIRYRFDGPGKAPGFLSGARTNQTDFSYYNSTKRGDAQKIRVAKSNQISSKGKTMTSRHARMQLPQGAKPAQVDSKKLIEAQKERAQRQMEKTGGRTGKQTVKDMQIMSAIGMMGGFANLVNSKQMSSTMGLANLASHSRNPFQLALGVTGKQAGRQSSNQAIKGRAKIVNESQAIARQLPNKSRGSLRLDYLGTLKKDDDEVGGDYSRDYEEVTEVTGPAGGEMSAPIRFRDELEAPENGVSMQQNDTLHQVAHSRRRLLSKQGLAHGKADVSYPQFGAPSEQELNPQFRVEFRKSNQRFNINNDRRWVGGHEPLGRARASSSGMRGYESALQEGSSEVANHNLGAGSVAASLPGNPRLISSDGMDLRGGIASQYGERRGGYETNTGEARQSRIGPRITEDNDVDTKEDPEEAQHTIIKNMKSSSARQTNESPYHVESKSSLRRQISLTKNLRKGRERKRGVNSNEDADELELMNDDDFVRAPLNLNMEISNDGNDKDNIYQIQRKAPSSVGASQIGASKKRVKNSTDLATGSYLQTWQTKDGSKQPLSQPNDPVSTDQRSPQSRENNTQFIDSPGKNQIPSPPSVHPRQHENTRSTEKVMHTKDANTDSLLQSPPLLDAKKERQRLMEIQSPSLMQDQPGAPKIISTAHPEANPEDEEGSPVPKTAEWSPIKAGGTNSFYKSGGRQTVGEVNDNDGTVTMGAGGASAGTVTLTKHTEVNGPQIQTLGAPRGSTGHTSRRLQFQMDNFEHQLDTEGTVPRDGKYQKHEENADETVGTLEKAQIVKNVVLFSKSPNQQMGKAQDAEQTKEKGNDSAEQKMRVADKESKLQQAKQSKLSKTQTQPMSMQLNQGKSRQPSRHEKTRILDLIKPNSALITTKQRNARKNLTGSLQRPLAITSAQSTAERLAKSGAVGYANPIPGWRSSEAGRLLKSYRTTNKSRQHNMAMSLRQGRLPLYQQGRNVTSAFQSRERTTKDKTAQDQREIEANRQEVNNQKAYLYGGKTNESKEYQLDQATQLDLTQIDQDVYASFYDQPYSVVVADGAGGLTAQIIGGLQREAEGGNVRPNSQTFLEQETQMLRDPVKGEQNMSGGDVLSPKSDIRLVTQEQEAASKPEVQAYHIQSVVFPGPGQSTQEKPVATRPGDRVSDQHQYDPPSTQYIDYSATNGGAAYAEGVQRQATSYQMSDQQLGATSVPGSNPLNQSLPRSLRGDMVLLGSQQLQSTISKNQKASTLVLPESQLGPRVGPEGHSGNDDANISGPGIADSRDNNFTGRDQHSSIRHQQQQQFFNQQIAQSTNGLQQYVANMYQIGNKFQQAQSSQQFEQQRESQVTEEQKEEIEQMILNHIMHSITSQENIQVILNSKNSNQLIYAKDANFMNQAVFNKFAKTWAQREGVRTNADDVLRECRDKIHHLYLEVASYFGMQVPSQINPGSTFTPSQSQYPQSPSIPKVPSSSQAAHRFRDLLSSNSREQIGENSVSGKAGVPGRNSKNVKFVVRQAPIAGSKDSIHQRASSQQSVGLGPKRQTSAGKRPDFNVQIKYKNSENEINQFRELVMSQIGRRNSFRIETAMPLSPQGREAFMAESQQFPKKLRTPIYPDAVPRAGTRQTNFGAKANARRQKRVSVAAGSSQATQMRAPSSTTHVTQPVQGKPSPTFKSSQFKNTFTGGAQQNAFGKQAMGGSPSDAQKNEQTFNSGTMVIKVGGAPANLDQQPMALSQEAGVHSGGDDALKFVVVGGGVPRNIPLRNSDSRSLAVRPCESAANRLQGSERQVGQLSRPLQNQYASQATFAAPSGQLISKRGGSQRYAGMNTTQSSKQLQNQSIPANEVGTILPTVTFDSMKQAQ